MTTLKHDTAIEWPNGAGFTPCTREYAEVTDKINDLNDFGRIGMGDMSSEDYETYNRLLVRRDELQLSGHLGESVRY
ncbi:hypothetical protein Hden_2990 [Hyphomicrobium denitrificans ATCC 51888]|uniref:Uncharacterized protein n=1 Tax=Hyphomicrobium denitrificans (strain ATCC 51888 / DSM 1869 / NCIMB 11706 / TK 0415) TaxID=582899 RepID=D8JVD1_HYPDA|nr:hypothetical protein [Hyphomicrobium denitrificans]ADJ24785.1 hypothetical protein Hden_2990 [Hyphomicrobium denitrificans ATCC 51888]